MMEDSFKHKGLRRQLVETLMKKGISNKNVLQAIYAIPRHFFLDSVFENKAYEDRAFPIADGQTISQPYTVAFQTSLLNPQPGDKILEIGTGSGFQCAVLNHLGAKVFTIERQIGLYTKSKEFLNKMKWCNNVRFFYGDGTEGINQHAPYNGIIVTAGAPVVPESLVNQLEIGGCLIIPIGDRESQKMYRFTKTKDGVKKETFGDFRFVPLKGKEGWKNDS
jgi:protein-L-isoaspartate(D-aspartate) O-methyltransferase